MLSTHKCPRYPPVTMRRRQSRRSSFLPMVPRDPVDRRDEIDSPEDDDKDNSGPPLGKGKDKKPKKDASTSSDSPSTSQTPSPPPQTPTETPILSTSQVLPQSTPLPP